MSVEWDETTTTRIGRLAKIVVLLGAVACGDPDGGSDGNSGGGSGDGAEPAGIQSCADYCRQVNVNNEPGFTLCLQECEEKRIEFEEIADTFDAIDETEGFISLVAGAIVTIEEKFTFVSGTDAVASCSWSFGAPAAGEPEGVNIIGSWRREQDSGDTFSFFRGADGDTDWTLFDEVTGDEWFGARGGEEVLACFDLEYYGPEFEVERLCQAEYVGVAGENFSVRTSFSDVYLYCLYASRDLPDPLPPLDCAKDDPCTVGIPGPRGECYEFPRDSRLTAIECDLDGELGMCVDGECAEYGCGTSCDDGDPGTSDRCRRADASGEAPFECVYADV